MRAPARPPARSRPPSALHSTAPNVVRRLRILCIEFLTPLSSHFEIYLQRTIRTRTRPLGTLRITSKN